MIQPNDLINLLRLLWIQEGRPMRKPVGTNFSKVFDVIKDMKI